MTDNSNPAKPDPKSVTVLVGDTQVTTPKKTTVRALLVAANLDPTKRQLVGITGKKQHPYTDLDDDLNLHDGQVFITVSIGPTPVS